MKFKSFVFCLVSMLTNMYCFGNDLPPISNDPVLKTGISPEKIENVANPPVIFKYRQKLASWTDPTTLPKTRNECVKWFITKVPFTGKKIKTCSGWKLQKSFMKRELWLDIDFEGITESVVKDGVSNCLKAAAVAGAVDAFVTGGTTTVATIQVACVACMKGILNDALKGALVDSKSYWGPWE